MEKNNKSKKKESLFEIIRSKVNVTNILLLLIVLVGIFFRFYNAEVRYSLGGDSSRDAIVAVVGAQTWQLPLTGPFSSAGPFTFGPWYYYHLILFTALTPFTYAPWILMGLASTAFILVLYKIGEELYDKRLGLIMAALAAVSSSTIVLGTALTNPHLISLYAGLTLLLFIMLIKGARSYWLSFVMGLALGIGINTHYQMLGYLWLIPLLFIFKKEARVVHTLSAIGGICVSFIPLGLFDMNNHWFTVRNLSDYYLNSEGRVYVPTRWLFYIRDFWPSFWGETFGLSKMSGYILIVAGLGTAAWLFYKRNINPPLIAIAILFLINFISLRYYWGEKFSGYLQFFFPILFIATALIFWKLSGRKTFYIGVVLLIIMLGFMLPSSIQRFTAFGFDQLVQSETKALIEYEPRGVIVYNCQDEYWDRSQGVTLLLEMNNKFNENGRKVGFTDDHCTYPVPGFNPETDATPSAKIIESHFPKIDNAAAVDLSSASDGALLEFGWKPIKPQNIYNSTLKWWYDEKP